MDGCFIGWVAVTELKGLGDKDNQVVTTTFQRIQHGRMSLAAHEHNHCIRQVCSLPCCLLPFCMFQSCLRLSHRVLWYIVSSRLLLDPKSWGVVLSVNAREAISRCDVICRRILRVDHLLGSGIPIIVPGVKSLFIYIYIYIYINCLSYTNLSHKQNRARSDIMHCFLT